MLHGGCATLPVADFDTALDFYEHALGLPCLIRFEEQWACLDAGDGLLVGLIPKALAPEGRQHLGLCTTRPFDEVVAVLEKHGVVVGEQRGADGSIRIAFFTDPDGNALYVTDTPPVQTAQQPRSGDRLPFLQHLGLRWVAHGDTLLTELDVRDDLRGPAGILQGGVIATMVDVAAAAAVGRLGVGLVATKEMAVKFVAPGRVGPVRATAGVVRNPDELIAEVEIVDTGTDDTVVAVGRATFAVLAEK